MIFSNFILL